MRQQPGTAETGESGKGRAPADRRSSRERQLVGVDVRKKARGGQTEGVRGSHSGRSRSGSRGPGVQPDRSNRAKERSWDPAEEPTNAMCSCLDLRRLVRWTRTVEPSFGGHARERHASEDGVRTTEQVVENGASAKVLRRRMREWTGSGIPSRWRTADHAWKSRTHPTSGGDVDLSAWNALLYVIRRYDVPPRPVGVGHRSDARCLRCADRETTRSSGKWWRERPCKPGPVLVPEGVSDSHFSGASVTTRLERPTRKAWTRASATSPSLFGLSPGGVYRAVPVTEDAGALLPHRFTLAARRADSTG